MKISQNEIKSVFGANCEGTDLAECAKKSNVVFVRSQVQLAFATERSTGHRLNAYEAFKTYGWEKLSEVAKEGSALLIDNINEPSRSLKSRRTALNITTEKLSEKTGIDQRLISQAETPGKISKIRDLEKLAQQLALDELTLGYGPQKNGDVDLGVRLRELAGGDIRSFTPDMVLNLTEAAWVISKQIKLCELLNIKMHKILSKEKSSNYNFLTYERGYELAEKTRHSLGLYNNEPIKSLRLLIENKIGIPVIQLSLSPKFAGATISNHNNRGIVVNEKGLNENVWIRRMTMCHELGHLLWDPDEHLNKLKVDDYDTIDSQSQIKSQDKEEIRANAFAVAFLFPPSAVHDIANREKDFEKILHIATNEYGISTTAATHHIKNILDIRCPRHPSLNPSDEWIAAENLTIDFFPIDSTPISRRGKFASLVSKCLSEGLISIDSAAVLLSATIEEISKKEETLQQLAI